MRISLPHLMFQYLSPVACQPPWFSPQITDSGFENGAWFLQPFLPFISVPFSESSSVSPSLCVHHLCLGFSISLQSIWRGWCIANSVVQLHKLALYFGDHLLGWPLWDPTFCFADIWKRDKFSFENWEISRFWVWIVNQSFFSPGVVHQKENTTLLWLMKTVMFLYRGDILWSEDLGLWLLSFWGETDYKFTLQWSSLTRRLRSIWFQTNRCGFVTA